MNNSEKIVDFDMKRKEELISKIRQCDSLHNNCDFLLDHNECDDIVEYVDRLNEEINKIGGNDMTKEELIEQIEKLQEQLYETNEEQEKLEECKKQSKLAAKSMKIMVEEFEKEGFSKELAIELIKCLGGNK